ncbi:MAG: hypothetical protein ABJ327_03285 [Litoreibacter sp.]
MAKQTFMQVAANGSREPFLIDVAKPTNASLSVYRHLLYPDGGFDEEEKLPHGFQLVPGEGVCADRA